MSYCLALLLSVFRIIVIPAQFEDTTFTYRTEDIRATLTTAEEYLNRQFLGTRDFSFEMANTVTLKHGCSYYGSNRSGRHDTAIYEAVTDCCRSINGSVDFSRYDNDEDGSVDCIVLLTAGCSESDGAGDNMIWPQQGWLHESGAALFMDGKNLDAFIVITELKSDKGENPQLFGIGDLCHEFLHTLGLPDLYDTDGAASGYARCLWGTTSIMDRGNRNDNGRTPPEFNAIEMEMLGLGTCDTLKSGQYALEPIATSHRYLKALTDNKDEYYLFECRKAEGWDRFIGGEGMLIYHIDKSDPGKWKTNRVNNDESRQCADLVEACPGAAVTEQVFFPQPDKKAFCSDSEPAFTFWDGRKSTLALTGIRRLDDGTVVFNVTEPLVFRDIQAFQDAAIISWSTNSFKGEHTATVSWSCPGEEECSETVKGVESCTIEHLKPKTDYTVRISMTDIDGNTFSVSRSFRTKSMRNNVHPYIYLNPSDRNEDGSFNEGVRIPLRVFNATDVDHTEWYFNAVRILPGYDSSFTLRTSGCLKAIVFHTDGSTDVIIKEITVKS